MPVKNPAKYWKKRRAEMRQRVLEYLGNCCQQCGYDEHLEVLELHHIDDYKDRAPGSIKYFSRSWERIVKELEHCELLCPTCHRLADLERDRKGA